LGSSFCSAPGERYDLEMPDVNKKKKKNSGGSQQAQKSVGQAGESSMVQKPSAPSKISRGRKARLQVWKKKPLGGTRPEIRSLRRGREGFDQKDAKKPVRTFISEKKGPPAEKIGGQGRLTKGEGVGFCVKKTNPSTASLGEEGHLSQLGGQKRKRVRVQEGHQRSPLGRFLSPGHQFTFLSNVPGWKSITRGKRKSRLGIGGWAAVGRDEMFSSGNLARDA